MHTDLQELGSELAPAPRRRLKQALLRTLPACSFVKAVAWREPEPCVTVWEVAFTHSLLSVDVAKVGPTAHRVVVQELCQACGGVFTEDRVAPSCSSCDSPAVPLSTPLDFVLEGRYFMDERLDFWLAPYLELEPEHALGEVYFEWQKLVEELFSALQKVDCLSRLHPQGSFTLRRPLSESYAALALPAG